MSPMDDLAGRQSGSTSNGGTDLPAQVTGAKPTADMVRSYQAFRRELPGLLASYPQQWVAFAGDRQLGIGTSQRRLYRDCLSAGYQEGQFLICSIELPQDIVLDELTEV